MYHLEIHVSHLPDTTMRKVGKDLANMHLLTCDGCGFEKNLWAHSPRDQKDSARKQPSFEQTEKKADSNEFSKVLYGSSASHDDSLFEWVSLIPVA